MIRHHMKPMTATRIAGVGFSLPIQRDRALKRRNRAFAEFITTAALVVSLAIAVIAVSIGIARADVSGTRTEVSCVQ